MIEHPDPERTLVRCMGCGRAHENYKGRCREVVRKGKLCGSWYAVYADRRGHGGQEDRPASLLTTNPYLRRAGAEERAAMFRRTADSSQAVEAVEE